jgi:hypothetical protein
MWGKANTYILLVQMQIIAITTEISMKVHQKTDNISTSWPGYTTVGHIYLKSCKSTYKRYTCTPKFITTLFTICKLLNQYKWLIINEWIRKMSCNICTYAYILSYISCMCIYKYICISSILCICRTQYYSVMKKIKLCHFQEIEWKWRLSCAMK